MELDQPPSLMRTLFFSLHQLRIPLLGTFFFFISQYSRAGTKPMARLCKTRLLCNYLMLNSSIYNPEPPVKTTNNNSSMLKHQSVNLQCKEKRDIKPPPPQMLLGLGSPPVRDHREPFPCHLNFCFRPQEDFFV